MKRVTKRMLDAARMLAEGMRPPDVAASIGVHPASVRRWMEDEDVMAEYRHCLRKASIAAVAKAQRVLEKQLESEAGGGFLAQNAANSILNRSYAAVMGEDKQEITIHLTGGLLDVGMPQRTDED